MGTKVKMLHPAYYGKFECIGAACEENCCSRPWRIKIDKPTYMQYRKVQDAEFAETLSKNIRRIRGREANDAHYAEFVIESAEHICPFQTETGLCEIILKQGPEYLCRTCQTYPRQLNQITQGLAELSLSMSCPEAVRVGLLTGEPFVFQLSEMEYSSKDKLLQSGQVVLDKNATPDMAEAHAWNIREACIDMLQSKSLPLAERILAIGMLLKKVTELDAEGKTAEISAVAAAYNKGMSAGEFGEVLAKFKKDSLAEAAIASGLYSSIAIMGQSKQVCYAPFNTLVDDFLVAYQKENSGEPGENLALPLYSFVHRMVNKHWEGIAEKHEQSLENYFVNYVFSTVFPFQHHENLSMYHHFILLAEQYAMLRMILCHAEENGVLTEQALTKAFTSVSHFSQHTQSASHIVEIYRAQNMDSLAHMSFLLR